MPTNNNPSARGDHLAVMLSQGKALSLDVVLSLCPDEPLADIDELDRQFMTPREHAEWRREAAELRLHSLSNSPCASFSLLAFSNAASWLSVSTRPCLKRPWLRAP
jgi:hypothetical protein